MPARMPARQARMPTPRKAADLQKALDPRYAARGCYSVQPVPRYHFRVAARNGDLLKASLRRRGMLARMYIALDRGLMARQRYPQFITILEVQPKLRRGSKVA